MVYSQRVLVIVFVMAIQLFYVRSFSILTRPSLRRSPQCIYSRLFSVKRVVFLGTPEVAASTLKTLHSNGSDLFDIVAVVTQPPKRRKRKGAIEHSPVGKMAQELNIPLLVPESAKDGDFLDTIEQKVRPDLCITAAYGQYLPKRFVAAPQLGTVNIHPSLLPRWRGASPVQRSLQAGDNPCGVSLLYTVSKMDAGPIIAQKEQEVDSETTATELLPMMFTVGTDLLLAAMPGILSGTITMATATPQDESLVTKADMIDSSEGELRFWEESATQLLNKLRGFAMWPGVYMHVKVEGRDEIIKVKVIKARVVQDQSAYPSDVIELGPNKKDGLYCVCHDGTILELLIVQPATKKPFSAKDLKNGYPGETLRWCKEPVEVKV